MPGYRKQSLPDLHMRHWSFRSISPPRPSNAPTSRFITNPFTDSNRIALLPIVSSPERVHDHPLPNRPVPIRPHVAHPPFPASVSLYDPASPLSSQAFPQPRQPKSNPTTSKPHTQHSLPQPCKNYDKSAWWQPHKT
ncbi:hypothetical protein JB92DRAFT_2034616 [Gautieria morchelliformis]|nr:hypothetical protein JB92DRAFT_2034616 [Gautieria morchelliformis]